jgi:hypothetical protein
MAASSNLTMSKSMRQRIPTQDLESSQIRTIQERISVVKGCEWRDTWVSICAESKLVPAWYIGDRDSEAATHRQLRQRQTPGLQ